jgi:hypothetical protein
MFVGSPELDGGHYKSQCINPEGTVGFLSLVESTPFHEDVSHRPDATNFRCTLYKKKERGKDSLILSWKHLHVA